MYTKKILFITSFCFIFAGGCVSQSTQENETKSPVIKTDKKTPKKEGWLINYEEVYEQSLIYNQPILANFTGSDWCGWCKKLKRAVFDTDIFKKWAKENVILFELDYPRRTPQDPEIKQQNLQLQQTFRSVVRGYPTVLLFDIERTSDENGEKQNDGINLLGKMGYMGDANSFISVAETNIKNRKK